MADQEKLPIDDVEAAVAEAPPSYGGTESNALPTYQQATEPPPSYTSIFGEIKDVRSRSSSVFDFLVKLLVLLAGTIGCTVVIGLVMAIPIAMIVIGAKYKDECPIEEKIPIYLIVGGSFGIFRNLVSLCQRARKKEGEEEDEKRRNPLESVLDCFLTAWFIAGNVWIYSNYEPNYTETKSTLYCHPTLYLFAFWVTTATYILLGTICLCLCCVGICAAAITEN